MTIRRRLILVITVLSSVPCPAHTAGGLLYFIAVAGRRPHVARVESDVRLVAWAKDFVLILFLASMAGTPGVFAIRGWLQRGVFVLVVVWVVLVGIQ